VVEEEVEVEEVEVEVEVEEVEEVGQMTKLSKNCKLKV
jgi:hypothetical protein